MKELSLFNSLQVLLVVKLCTNTGAVATANSNTIATERMFSKESEFLSAGQLFAFICNRQVCFNSRFILGFPSFHAHVRFCERSIQRQY